MSGGGIRVLVVDDSALMRQMIVELLGHDQSIEVAGEATNGAEAVALARQLRPDVITMDLEMPVMSGIDAISEIMDGHATPILVLSSVATASTACDAIARGALEVIDKSPESLTRDLCRRLRLLAGVPVIRHYMRARPATGTQPAQPAPSPSLPPRNAFFIASSTGGPQLLADLLMALPAHFPAPIVIAQHISNGFSAGMVEWFDSITPLRVLLASDGCLIEPSRVLVVPSEWHGVVSGDQRLRLTRPEDGDIYHPSCDRLLESAARHYGRHAIGVILTGMGRDGVSGIRAIHQAGGTTLAQNEASSVIYGMNRLAVESGAVDRVVDPQTLVEEMVWLAESGQ